MNHDVTVDEYINQKEHYIPVDVRSPIEFEDSHIPTAVNIPLFTNEERAEIGTIYKQQGKNAAKWRAMEFVAPKLPALLAEIKGIEESGKKPLLYCWRGGNRSQSMTHFATMAGLHIKRLEGGFRAYREYVLQVIPELIPEKAIVIYGLTGTGKTDILHALKRLGYPVLDLEGYANHRGSVFGAVTGETPHNQKMFDALLFEGLLEIQGSPYFFMEGESKRIGHAVQPPALYVKKENGLHIHVVSSLEARVETIHKEYVQDTIDFQERVGDALNRIIKRIKQPDIVQRLQECLQHREYKEMIYLLMVHYYDPRYDNKINETLNKIFTVESDQVDHAVNEIMAFVDRLY